MKKFITSILIILCIIPCWILYGLMYVVSLPLIIWGCFVQELEPYEWTYNITDQFPMR